MSDRDDELPDVAGAAHDADSTAREERIDALLSLSSTAPASLDANIAARRAAGDRVILPVDGAEDVPHGSSGTAAGTPRRHRLTLLLSVGLAAAAAILLFTRGDDAGTGSDRRTPPDLAGTDSPPAPIVAGRDSFADDSLAPRDSGARLAPAGRDDVALGFERTQPAGASFGARLEQFSNAAIDSTVAAARRDPAATVAIRYPATSTELSALAQRVEDALVAAGIAPGRITRAAYAATVMRADVSITVGGIPQPR